jgi:hypothetical protein
MPPDTPENINNPLNIPGSQLSQRPEPAPIYKRINTTKGKIVLAIVGLVIIVAVVGNALTGQTTSEQIQSTLNTIVDNVSKDEAKITPQRIISDTVVEPKNDAIYYGSYNGTPVIFRTNARIKSAALSPANPDRTYGEALLPSGFTLPNIRFSNINEPKEVFFNEEIKIEDISSFTLSSEDPNIFYITLVSQGSSVRFVNLTQRIYKIDANKGEQRLVLLHEVGSDKYENGYGMIKIIDEFPPNHILLEVEKCLSCQGDSPAGHLVINALTRALAYHKSSGGFEHLPETSEYSYKILIPIIDDDRNQYYLPIGTLHTLKLP